MNYLKTLLSLSVLLILIPCRAQINATPPEELGKVNWHRDFDKALQLSQKQDKPVFILFQEVPGCMTCRNYGRNVMSHPLVVEAIETLFVPLAIFNNKSGADAEVLRYYKEPSWNNPVVRVVDHNKKNVAPRLAGNYSKLGVVQAMVTALEEVGKEVPGYLLLFEQELSARAKGTESATFSMYCFWTGEKTIGSLPGVVETQPGFMNGREVVQVEFDPSVTSFERLLEGAKAGSCAQQVYYEDEAQRRGAEKVIEKQAIAAASHFQLDKEPKYYLSKTIYKYVPMTALQAVQANILVAQKNDLSSVLSPRQIELAKYINNHPQLNWQGVIGEDMMAAWEAAQVIRTP